MCDMIVCKRALLKFLTRLFLPTALRACVPLYPELLGRGIGGMGVWRERGGRHHL